VTGKNGVLEYWNNGMMGNTGMLPIHNPTFHHSITPLFELDTVPPFIYKRQKLSALNIKRRR
jgi:hypothetical protein